MKTQNYQFDLMHQGLEYKDVVYNETILKIDSLLNSSVTDFTKKPPTSLALGEKYIIQEGEHINKICYFAHTSKGVQYILPSTNMIVYVLKTNSFYIYANDDWKKINMGSGESISSSLFLTSELIFTGISDKYNLPKQEVCHYLYLNGNTALNFGKPDSSYFTLIIKQNYQSVFDIKWPTDILWQNKTPAKISNKINAIDLFRFYRLPESNHFIAETISQNYQY